MSQKQVYLVKRSDRLTDGKPTYYARFRDESGELLPWKSTGQTTKTRAENWALRQFKQGRIATRENLSFGRYAEKWWKWGECDYIRGKLARGKSLSRRYAEVKRGYLDNHILPAFREKSLVKITPRMIERWVLGLKDEPMESGERLSPTTVNHCLTTLKTMLREATRLGYIPSDPSAFVEQLKETPKAKQILTVDEMKKLFRDDALTTAWDASLVHFTLNLLAASTGLRMGEVQGLQVQHIHPGYVAVVHSWERKYGLKEPKWNSVREVPIPSKTSRYLGQLIEESPFRDPEDLVFHGRAPRAPIGHKEILAAFYSALKAIGVTEAARAKRNITFHSWRHLFNSVCRAKIPDYKLQRLTGHRTQAMTERYTHVNLEDYRDVAELQEENFG